MKATASSIRTMFMTGAVFLLALLPITMAFAAAEEAYFGEARLKDGTLVYTEHHTASFDENGKILTARTVYKDPAGRIIGKLQSNFSESITAPTYDYVDLRTNEYHGIRTDKEHFILFVRQPESGNEKTLKLKKDFIEDGLIVGCQGLHYYLRENLDIVRQKDTIDIKFLIPGDLDYYSFRMNYEGEDQNVVRLKVSIDNFFLRLFAPSLLLKYDKKRGRLLNYVGLSNIKSDKGKIQNVVIKYFYED